MTRRKERNWQTEALESRLMLSGGTYVVSEVDDLALSQPLINYYLTRTPGGPPLQGDGSSGYNFNGTAYLDTGTSGTILSEESTSSYGINTENENGSQVIFNDIGINGGSEFYVSEPLYIGLATSNPNADIDDSADYAQVYNQNYGPVRMELNPYPSDDDDFFYDPTDIMGMPTMMGKVVVMDPSPVFSTDPNTFGDMNTYIYNPGTPYDPSTATTDPGIPPTSLHVKVSYGDFAPYTTLDPSDAIGPNLAPNPIIGPDPLEQFESDPPPDNTPPVSFSLGQYSATGSFLFDTGAEGSFISQAEAAKMHVYYKAGTYGTDNPELVDDNGNPIPNQSVVPYSGFDNSVVYVSEFYLDSLTLQTQEGIPIKFLNVPISVLDIGLTDPNTGQTLVLDGDFGVNFLMASRNDGNDPAFNWITFDQPDGTIGFAPGGSISPGNATVAGRFIFYNDSVFDGNNSAINSLDANAIATDKQALLPSATSSSFANVTSDTNGINGIMVDISQPAGTPTESDFAFLVGNSLDGSTWTNAPTPSGFAVLPGQGVNGSTRVEITWPNGSMRNEWIQVTVDADADTGLAAPDTFFFGNLIGYSGTTVPSGVYTVTSADVNSVTGDFHSFLDPASITDPNDFNRDGRVDATDVMITEFDSGQSLIVLSSSALQDDAAAAIANAASAAKSAAPAVTPPTAEPSNKSLLRKAHRRSWRLDEDRIQSALRRVQRHPNLIHSAKTRARIVAMLKSDLASARALDAAGEPPSARSSLFL